MCEKILGIIPYDTAHHQKWGVHSLNPYALFHTKKIKPNTQQTTVNLLAKA